MVHPAVHAATVMVLDTLTDDELAAVNLALAFGTVKPYHLGYDKVKVLFTQGDDMHEDVKRVIEVETIRRLS